MDPSLLFISGTRLMHYRKHEPWIGRIGLEPMSCHVLWQWYSDPWSHWEGPEFQKLCHLKPPQPFLLLCKVRESDGQEKMSRCCGPKVAIDPFYMGFSQWTLFQYTRCMGCLVLGHCELHIYPKSTNVIFALNIF